MPAFEAGNAAMLVFNGLTLAAGLVWALYYARRRGNLIPLCLLPGGAIASIHEPLIDVVGHCFVPYSAAWSAFSLYGRPITWWHPVAYAVFYGVMPGILYAQLKSGLNAGRIALLMLLIVLMDVVMEAFMSHWGTWSFYGVQPLTVAGMPLWWGAMNCTGILMTATVIYLLDEHLRGWRALWLVVWVPIQHAAEIALVGWPSWAVVNSDAVAVVRELGGVASFAIAVAVCMGCIYLIENRRKSVTANSR